MSRDHGSRVSTVTLRNDEFVFGPVRYTKALFRKEADPIWYKNNDQPALNYRIKCEFSGTTVGKVFF